jgi:tetratricopeptide (TPR) repeat protein
LKEAINASGRRPVMIGMLGRTYVADGKVNEAIALLNEMQTPPINNDKLYASAVIKFSLGKYDDAYAIFEKLIAEKYGIMIYMKVEKAFFSNNTDPRYEALVKKMGL